MRPTYENSTTRKNEMFFQFLFPEYIKLPKKFGFDFLFPSVSGAFITELKVRNYDKLSVPDGQLLLSYHKVLEMERFPAAGKSIMFLLNDGLFSIGVGEYLRHYVSGPAMLYVEGRKDRGDWQDIEPCVRYPVDKLRLIRTKEEIVEAWNEWNASKQ